MCPDHTERRWPNAPLSKQNYQDVSTIPSVLVEHREHRLKPYLRSKEILPRQVGIYTHMPAN